MNFQTHSTKSETDFFYPKVTFKEFLDGFKNRINHAFHVSSDINKLSINRRLPQNILNEIMQYNPLSVCIPIKYGGMGAPAHECMAIMSEASYESLALSLTLSINYALFIQPVTKYALDEVKAPIFKRFMEQQNMGGLMITEPGHGTDALNMQTSYTEENGNFHLKGKKHWAGLTGMANYWLLTARKMGQDGLRRDIDFFICDVNADGQSINVEEYFENLGLYQIPYGLNNIDVKIPLNQRLQPKTSGVMMMLDILHRNRLQFPGMGVGFIKRLHDEAIKHCKSRSVGGRSLISFDQVQHRLASLQAYYTTCSVLCIVGSKMASLDNDLSSLALEANIIKCVTSDIMQEASQSLLQLVGAKGFKLDHIAGRSIVDSRPFQIFEGSNDVLYHQIADSFIKIMMAAKESNFQRFIKVFHLTDLIAERLQNSLEIQIDKSLPQRKQVILGRLISRIVTMNYLLKVKNNGFRPDLIENALDSIQNEVLSILSAYTYQKGNILIEDFEENSFWLDFV
jgi:alkylation response protein AidB-like acyl-CoA dehydrogenase